MLVVIRPMPFPKAPEERHKCRSSGASCFLGYLYATNISLLTELEPCTCFLTWLRNYNLLNLQRLIDHFSKFALIAVSNSFSNSPREAYAIFPSFPMSRIAG